ncbi:hypothetical protein GCM10023107_30960 [Actinoplanes octamycinicus]
MHHKIGPAHCPGGADPSPDAARRPLPGRGPILLLTPLAAHSPGAILLLTPLAAHSPGAILLLTPLAAHSLGEAILF